MAGHSKWANIKHRKGAQDAKRGKIFTKIIREITVSARLGGPLPEDNPRLRTVMDKALAANMSRDTIDRAIKRGAGGGDEADVEELTYEGYGPGGIAVFVEAMTNNRNRTVGEVRHAFTKSGGNLGTDGSVNYLFNKQGVLEFSVGVDEDKLLEVALDAGADDLLSSDEGVDVITTPEAFFAVKQALISQGFTPDSAEITLTAATQAEITDVELAEKVVRLIDHLEDLDDVQNVYSNAHIPTAILEQMS